MSSKRKEGEKKKKNVTIVGGEKEKGENLCVNSGLVSVLRLLKLFEKKYTVLFA